MKKIFLAVLPLVFVIACKGQAGTKDNRGKEDYFNAKYVRLVKDTIVLMLIENVRIGYGDMRFEADSALLDKANKTITGYGVVNMYFKGEKIESLRKFTAVRYRNGDPAYKAE